MYVVVSSNSSFSVKKAFCNMVCSDRSNDMIYVYRVLVDSPVPLTLEELSSITSLPRTRLWRILSDLLKLGLVKYFLIKGKKYWVSSGLYNGLLYPISLGRQYSVDKEYLIRVLTELLMDYSGRPWVSSIKYNWVIYSNGLMDYSEERSIIRLSSEPISIAYTTYYYSLDDYSVKVFINDEEVGVEVTRIPISRDPPLTMVLARIPLELEYRVSSKTPIPGIIRVRIIDRKRAIAVKESDKLILCFNYTPIAVGAYEAHIKYRLQESIKILEAERVEDKRKLSIKGNIIKDYIRVSRERQHKITHKITIYTRTYNQRNWILLKTKTICPQLPTDIIQY